MTATISYSTTLHLTASEVADQATPEFFADLLLSLPQVVGSFPKWTAEYAAECARVINGGGDDDDRTEAVDLLKAILAAIGEKDEAP